ncbi:hypothetical protein Tco_0238102 [Tanacetum coccineum]
MFMVQDTPVEETIFMAIEDDESDDDLEEEDNQFSHYAFMYHPGPPTKIAEMVQSKRLEEQKMKTSRGSKAQLLKKQPKIRNPFSRKSFHYLETTPCLHRRFARDTEVINLLRTPLNDGDDRKSETSNDPVTGREFVRKSREWSARIPKFDLKSGFHQVAMDEESIPWTAFLVPGGLYEWLLGNHLRPLYEKTNAHGDKRLKPSDYVLVRKIKEQGQNLPDLEIPPENAHIILETDGCMEGWGGIVKWKKARESRKAVETMQGISTEALLLMEKFYSPPMSFRRICFHDPTDWTISAIFVGDPGWNIKA